LDGDGAGTDGYGGRAVDGLALGIEEAAEGEVAALSPTV
jgi:hypothetical protein